MTLHPVALIENQFSCLLLNIHFSLRLKPDALDKPPEFFIWVVDYVYLTYKLITTYLTKLKLKGGSLLRIIIYNIKR
jgi:hypothetical protein